MTTQVLGALRAKRLEIAAQVHDTEAKLAKLRAALANLDAAANLLTPGHPDEIPRRRAYRHTKYFGHNELSRLTLTALREAKGRLTAVEIAAYAVKAKDLPVSATETVTQKVLTILNKLGKKGEIVKSGTTRNAQWAVVALYP
jgi:hypothetical protein